MFAINFDELSKDDLVYVLKRIESSLKYLKDISAENKRNAERAADDENFRAQDYYLNRSHALQTAYEQVLNDINSGLEIISKTCNLD